MPECFKRRASGFTLLEVIIAMALIAILSAVTTLSMAFYIPNLRLKMATQEINVQLRKARLEAIRQSSRCYIDFFRTVDGQTYSPFIWMELEDEDGDPTDDAVYEPLDGDADGIVDTVVFRTPVTLVGGEWELVDYAGIRYDVAFGGGDGVTFPVPAVPGAPVNSFYLNSRGVGSHAGSVYLRNARGKSRQILVTLGGATRTQ